MEYSLLGPTGVKVSKICLGTATFGVAPDAQEAGRVVHAALDLGINFFDTAKRQGKLRYVALSNHPAWQVTQALWIADDRHLAAAPVCAQVKYNLIDRAAEDELAPACQQFGLSIVPFGPLHGG